MIRLATSDFLVMECLGASGPTLYAVIFFYLRQFPEEFSRVSAQSKPEIKKMLWKEKIDSKRNFIQFCATLSSLLPDPPFSFKALNAFRRSCKSWPTDKVAVVPTERLTALFFKSDLGQGILPVLRNGFSSFLGNNEGSARNLTLNCKAYLQEYP